LKKIRKYTDCVIFQKIQPFFEKTSGEKDFFFEKINNENFQKKIRSRIQKGENSIFEIWEDKEKPQKLFFGKSENFKEKIICDD